MKKISLSDHLLYYYYMSDNIRQIKNYFMYKRLYKSNPLDNDYPLSLKDVIKKEEYINHLRGLLQL